MSKAAKRLERMRVNPRDDWRIDDIEAVCRVFGIDCDPPTTGSHYTVSHPTQERILTVPARRPIKPFYIEDFVEFVSRVRRETGQ